MTIFRVSHDKNYTCVNNTIITDPTLSWKAKGIWLYAYSRPDDWQFHMSDLIKHSKDGIDSIRKGLAELEEAGYLIRRYTRDSNNKFLPAEWQFFEIPQVDSPSLDFPFTANPMLLNTDTPSIENTKVNDKTPKKPMPPPLSVDSVLFKTNKKSVFKGRLKLSDDQNGCLDWLLSLELDTGYDTLSWWARKYPMSRLDEVYRESRQRNPRSMGAYMQKLLKDNACTNLGRIDANKLFTKETLQGTCLSIKMHKKHAFLVTARGEFELDFSMEPLSFARYLMQKIEEAGL